MSEDYLRRLTEAVERIANHLTHPDSTGPVMHELKRRHYGEQSPQQEMTDGIKGIRRPKQASRS